MVYQKIGINQNIPELNMRAKSYLTYNKMINNEKIHGNSFVFIYFLKLNLLKMLRSKELRNKLAGYTTIFCRS